MKMSTLYIFFSHGVVFFVIDAFYSNLKSLQEFFSSQSFLRDKYHEGLAQ